MAAQADRNIAWFHLMAHLVVVPDQLGLSALAFGEGPLIACHSSASLVTVTQGPHTPSVVILMPSMLGGLRTA
ncbi:hypothetical protein [Streptomyces violaceusniger]|uniref:hypothetical protein n=1 Tax=Streptomyces violaceusniger TaxID=68280 RepID=UPI0031E18E1B